MAAAADEARLAAAMGCDVEPGFVVSLGGRRYVQYRVTCDDNRTAIALLDALATLDARENPRVVAIARSLVGASEAETARAIMRFVQHGVRYERDDVQWFRSSDATLSLGVGNCVNTARLVVALARAAGLAARAVPVPNPDGEIVHTAAQIRVDHEWRWAESSVPGAELGESPYDVARRLRVTRDGLRRAA